MSFLCVTRNNYGFAWERLIIILEREPCADAHYHTAGEYLESWAGRFNAINKRSWLTLTLPAGEGAEGKRES